MTHQLNTMSTWHMIDVPRLYDKIKLIGGCCLYYALLHYLANVFYINKKRTGESSMGDVTHTNYQTDLV